MAIWLILTNVAHEGFRSMPLTTAKASVDPEEHTEPHDAPVATELLREALGTSARFLPRSDDAVTAASNSPPLLLGDQSIEGVAAPDAARPHLGSRFRRAFCRET